MSRNALLYVASGLLFLLAAAFDLPDLDLHGWLFLTVGLACFAVAAGHAGARRARA